jgi:hypothetical protein
MYASKKKNRKEKTPVNYLPGKLSTLIINNLLYIERLFLNDDLGFL